MVIIVMSAIYLGVAHGTGSLNSISLPALLRSKLEYYIINGAKIIPTISRRKSTSYSRSQYSITRIYERFELLSEGLK